MTMVALSQVKGNTTTYALAAQLIVRANETKLSLYGADADGGPFGPTAGGTIATIAAGNWIHIEIDLAITSAGGTASVALDNNPASTFDISGTPTTGINAATLEIGALLAQYAPRDSTFQFDNVVMDVE